MDCTHVESQNIKRHNFIVWVSPNGETHLKALCYAEPTTHTHTFIHNISWIQILEILSLRIGALKAINQRLSMILLHIPAIYVNQESKFWESRISAKENTSITSIQVKFLKCNNIARTM